MPDHSREKHQLVSREERQSITRRHPREDRGLAHQIDFMTSMIIRIVAFGILLAASTTLVHNAVGTDYSNKVVAERGASRLADDLLVTEPGDAILNATCTDAFFRESTDVCGFKQEWVDSASYLNTALAIDSRNHINVTVTSSTGDVASIGDTTLSLGDAPPRDYGTVFTWHRQVGLDSVGDGVVRWHTITVSVWE